ncbi:hypothetical protein [Marinifilum fragile]|uniref:hypothetical protein n=1 Tax=Marinifilum fragile TaxID=570161 RepID=UPI002AA90AEE|nr:hypothetical protein [Marinifilum fragile]
MKKLLLFILFIAAGSFCFGQEIITKKDRLSKIEGLTYTIVHYKDGGNGRSEVAVDVADGQEWKFYDKTAKKLRRVFLSQADLLNFMHKHGWKLKEMSSLKPQFQSFIFIRKEA